MKAIDIKHAEIGTVTSRVDGAVAFRVITPELSLEQRAVMLGLHGKNVRIMMEPIDVPIEALVEVESEAEPKSKCQRLRAVLFVWWKQKCGSQQAGKAMTFEEFYHLKMESIINKAKEALEPE
jgi:hypothetical protein